MITAIMGSDLYLPKVMREYATAEMGSTVARMEPGKIELRIRELSSDFFAAAWELCRRDVIHPGVRGLNFQSTDAGNGGCGYCITPFGRTWLSESHVGDFVPTETQRFGRLLSQYQNRCGAGFQERAQQAVRCYGPHAYLACCAMCGAAAESIILSSNHEERR